MTTGENDPQRIEVQALWEKYEDIAMHFNDLLIRLRLRSLAGVAAVSTLVGIFANKANADLSVSWLVAAGLFGAMTVVWIAIFYLDFYYYNKLLNGAVAAITQLETETREGRAPSGINLSTLIEQEFTESKGSRASFGVMVFYAIVFAFVVSGCLFSLRMYQLEPDQPALSAVSAPDPASPGMAVPSPTPT